MLRLGVGGEEGNDELHLGRLSLRCLWDVEIVLSRRHARWLDLEAGEDLSLPPVQKSSQPFQ